MCSSRNGDNSTSLTVLAGNGRTWGHQSSDKARVNTIRVFPTTIPAGTVCSSFWHLVLSWLLLSSPTSISTSCSNPVVSCLFLSLLGGLCELESDNGVHIPQNVKIPTREQTSTCKNELMQFQHSRKVLWCWQTSSEEHFGNESSACTVDG